MKIKSHSFKTILVTALLASVTMSAQAAPPRNDIPASDKLETDLVELRPYRSAYLQASCNLRYGGPYDGQATIELYQVQEFQNLRTQALVPRAVFIRSETLNLLNTPVDSRWGAMRDYCNSLIFRQCHLYNYHTETYVNDTFAALYRTDVPGSTRYVGGLAGKCR